MADRLIQLAELLFPHWSPLAGTYRALVLLEQGQLERAALCCDQLADKIHHRDGLHRTDGLVRYVRGALARRQGDVETACSLFAELERWVEHSGEVDPAHLPWACDAVAAYLACGREAEARHVLDRVAQRTASLPSRWPKVAVAAGEAALAAHTGNLARADEYFTQALELQPSYPCR
jgi:tetratricopeptide (TPR) repeat protein